MNKLQQLIERDQWAELLTSSADLYKQSIHTTIEILAFTEKEAIIKACEIFTVPKEHLIIEEIHKGSSSFFGFIKVPSRYTFSVKEEFKAQYTENTINYDEYNNLAKNKNGSFRLIMKTDGLHLTVFPPKGIGHIVTLEDITNELVRLNYTNINPELIKKAIDSFQPQIIFPYTHVPSLNSEFTISVSKDKMEATLRFTKPRGHGRIPDLQEILSELRQQNIIIGINKDTIAEALDNELYNMPIVIAQGIPPQNGLNAYIEYKFSTGDDEFKYAVRSDGSVNFKELNIIHNVHAHDVLAIMHPYTRGSTGYNIHKEAIPAIDGVPVEWNIGQNVVLSADRTKAIAEQAGQVYLKNKQLCVDPALDIASDVDLSTGNINFLGNVIVKGNISDGFSVVSGGNIEVYGHIGKCFLSAEGNIIAHQGIQGKDDAQIECKGNLFAHFIERASLSIGGNLIINKALLHSKVIVDKGIYVLDEKKAIIAGGDIKAQNEIITTQLGAESYIDTFVEVGYSKNILRKNIILQKNIDKLTSQISEQKAAASHLPPDSIEAKLIHQNLKTLITTQEKNEGLFEQNRTILHKLGRAGSISVSKAIMPGVKIKIGSNTLDITLEQNAGTIKNDAHKQIILGAYKPSTLLAEFKSNAAQKSSTRKR